MSAIAAQSYGGQGRPPLCGAGVHGQKILADFMTHHGTTLLRDGVR